MKKGFSLLEVILATAIFLSGALAVYNLLLTTLRLTADEQARTGAFALIEQQLELAHNLPYLQVGVVGGIPPGSLPQVTTRTYNNLTYTLTTSVMYVDDPFDGTLGSNPSDPVPTDYKRIRVSASWRGRTQTQTVFLLTDVSPAGLENTAGGGALAITVLNANGIPIPQASVHISNTTVNPSIDLTLLTNDQGQIILPGTPPADDSYIVSASKPGYSTEQTMLRNPPTLTTPALPAVSVILGQTTPVVLRIDRPGTLFLTVRDPNGDLLEHNVILTLKGNKPVGTNPNPTPPPDTLPVLKYPTQQFTTQQGAITIPNLEWDTYSLNNLSPEYDLAGSNPPNVTTIDPNSTLAITWTMVPHANQTLLVSVQKPDGSPLPSAEVTLTQNNEVLAQEAGASGQTFFTPLLAGPTDLSISAPGYQTFTDTITISGQTTIILKLNQL